MRGSRLALGSSTKTLRRFLSSESYDVVIIGGGVVGASVAYHLRDRSKCLLLEQHEVTSGTTWHAAGLINTFGSLSSTSTWIRKYTKRLYKDILPRQGLETGYIDNGFIELACDEDRLFHYRRVMAFNQYMGVQVQELSAEEVLEKFPIVDTKDILAGFYVEDDGRVNPTDVTRAMLKASKCDILEHTPARDVVLEQNRVLGVQTDQGMVTCTTVVNCTGMWAQSLGQRHNLILPNQAAEHYYVLTERCDVPNDWPVIEDSSRCTYIRPESGGLLVGLFEREGESTDLPTAPYSTLNPDWDRMAETVELALGRLAPEYRSVGIKELFCGPESFTPDHNPMVGETSVQNYFVAAGMNSLGILSAGGVGKIVADWIVENRAPMDVDATHIVPTRFQAFQNTESFRKERVREVLGDTYRVPYPDHQPTTCRNQKLSALHGRLQESNACFRDVSGWESPAWFGNVPNPSLLPETFGKPHWFDFWQAEHEACRNDVVMFDMSFMAKFLVSGGNASSYLNWLCTANVDQDDRITYTQCLNDAGHLLADITVTKLQDGSFLVVATDTQHAQMHHYLCQNAPNDVRVQDVTNDYTQLNLQGPRSRQVLAALTGSDVSNDAFPFRCATTINIGSTDVLCTRITYVGELGYELFVPPSHAVDIYDQLSSQDVRPAGLKALGSLRLEKGYRDYGHDIDNTDQLVEAGLAFTCDFAKELPFRGQTMVEDQLQLLKTEGLKQRLVSVLVPGECFVHHGDLVYVDGVPVADIRSASFGHTVGGSVGLAMLKSPEPITVSTLRKLTCQVGIGRELYPAKLSLKPLYDPKNTKVSVVSSLEFSASTT